MSDLPSWHRYLRFWRSNVGADVDDEIAFHVDARAAELVDAGVDPDTARTRALREFGDVDRARHTLRAMDEHHYAGQRRSELLLDFWQDVRVAIRSLARSPGFVVVVALTLALGIGLNTAVYSIVDAYLFRPLPVPAGDRLVVVGQTDAALPQPHEMSYPNYLDYRDDKQIFASLAAYTTNSMNLAGGSGADRIWTEETSANFFDVLGVKPLVGRLFAPDEDAGELAHPVIVLTYDFWQSHFGGSSAVIGDTIRLNDHPIRIIGVTPPGFHGVDPLLRMSAFTSLNQTWPSFGAALRDRGNTSFNLIGTLRPGLSVAAAQKAVAARAHALEREYPSSNRNVGAVLLPERMSRPNLAISANVPTIATAFMLLVLLVLAVACANVASLLLARATSQLREQAIRAALGASQWRLARRVLIECLVLATVGGAGAIALAYGAVHLLGNVRVAADVPIHWTMTIDGRVLAYTLLIVAVTGVVAAVAPMLLLRRTDVTDALKSGARGSGGGLQRLRAILVVGQMAVCVSIVVCAGLFARSATNALRIDPGFRTRDILMATATLGMQGYDSTRGKQFELEIQRRVAALPGVRSVALARYTPFGYNNDIEYAKPEIVLGSIPENGLGCFNNIVTPGYFATMGMAIVDGRGFTDSDNESSRKVAVVTRQFARRLWPNERAVGKRFRVGKEGPLVEIVGVTNDIQYFSIGETPRPFFFRPYAQAYRSQFTITIQTAADPVALIPSLRATFTSLDPNLAVFDVRSLADHIANGRALLGTRVGAVFAAIFGALALALAAVGLYGLMSYAVVQRTREIGIRVALGAGTGTVLRLVLKQGLVVAGLGVTAGIIVTMFVTKLLSRLLYGVAPHDPAIFAAVGATLAIVGALASLVPARRAARVDPLIALRAD
jgi:predicted permease